MKTNKRLIPVVSLFFVIASIVILGSPSPAQAAWFVWKKQEKPVIIATASSQESSWSFEDMLFGSDEDDSVKSISANLLLGMDVMAKKTLAGTPAIRGLTYTVEASAYSSTPDQTDESPFITAKGTRVRAGIIAANFLPFGTIVKIPELYGDRTFVVEDRMNSRYQKHIDIWFPDRESAMSFGRKRVVIEIASN